MQDFAENAWNRALLLTLPRLLQVHLRWIAHAQPINLAKAYDILPDMESLQESLQKFDEKMADLTQRFGDLEDEMLRHKDVKEEKMEKQADDVNLDASKQHNALKSNVRSLQIQMEGVEQAQTDLLQQLRKAESRFISSLEKQVAVHQETLDEHCRDLADQLCKSPAVDQTSSISSPTNLRPEAISKLEETLSKLSDEQDQLEAQIEQVKSRQEQSYRSLEELVRQNCVATEDLGMTISSMSDLQERMSLGMEETKEEVAEQIRVLRQGTEAKLASMEDAISQQESKSRQLEESTSRQLEASIVELDKKLVSEQEARASEWTQLRDQRQEDQSRLAADMDVLREATDTKFASVEESTSRQLEASIAELDKKLVSEQEARASELTQLRDQRQEDQSRLATEISEWAGKFEKIDVQLHNFEDSMETRRAAQQREVDRLFTELQRSFDKLEGTQKTMLSDTLPEVASAFIQPVQKDVADMKENLSGFQDKMAEQGQMWESLDKEIKSAAAASIAACDALKQQLQNQIREVVSSETDAVLKAMTGRVSQEEQERVSSMTAVQKDVSHLQEALQQLNERNEYADRSLTGIESWRIHTPSVSPARISGRGPPFGVTGVGGNMDGGQRRKDLCRRKFVGSAGPGHVRTPR